VRRQSKKRSGIVKNITTAAVVVALTSGSFTAYAAEGITELRVNTTGEPGYGTTISVSALDDDFYRNAVINAFLTGDTLLAHRGGNWYEISETAYAERGILGGETASNGEDHPQWLPYDED